MLVFYCAISMKAQPAIALESFATGFTFPVDVENAGDERVFVVERLGYIKITDLLGNVFPDNFLDIHTLVQSGYQEQGLLGLAFHPNYAENGFFYVNYTDISGNTVISRFTVDLINPNLADPASELVLFTADQPFTNHNGGCVKFGADGYLYFGLGDGGSAGDPGSRAQNPMNKLGKMHRIDVDGATPYAIPDDNPFATATDTLKEIWAIGYRNPWRFSFDKFTGNMWVGDVGQNLHEEIDFENAGSGGHNYGWKCYEGFSEFNLASCDEDTSYVFPILDYPHNFTTGGFSITGGFVYRGSLYPGMFGYYISADYVSGNWWRVNADGGLPWIYDRMDDIATDISAYGVDVNGELYCADYNAGIIYHITDACGDFVLSSEVTDYYCAVSEGAVDLTVTAGEAPYSFSWSNGEETEDLTNLSEGMYTVVVTDNTGCERSIRVTIENIPAFDLNISVLDNVLTADAGISWQWYLDGAAIAGATDISYTALITGNYYVVATDINDCSVQSEEVTINILDINTWDAINQILIYPNPIQDIINIQIDYNGIPQSVEVSIKDIVGNTILQKTENFIPGNNNLSYTLPQLASGIYVLNIINNNQVLSRNFVK